MMHSYPWYITDWRESEAVAAMTAEQRGIYRDLLDICWREGSLPTDQRTLRKLAMAEPEEWERSWPVVAKQFSEIGGRLRNEKVDEKRPTVLLAKDSRKNGGTVRAKTAIRVGGKFAPAQHQQNTSDAGEGPGEQVSSTTPAEHQPSPSPSPSPSPGANAPFARDWREEIEPLQTAYDEAGACPGGKTLTDADWTDAHWVWRSLDFEQKIAAVQGIRRQTAVGVDPQFYSKPRRYLERREWQAEVRSRSPSTVAERLPDRRIRVVGGLN